MLGATFVTKKKGLVQWRAYYSPGTPVRSSREVKEVAITGTHPSLPNSEFPAFKKLTMGGTYNPSYLGRIGVRDQPRQKVRVTPFQSMATVPNHPQLCEEA
jgi:hypothetical protein